MTRQALLLFALVACAVAVPGTQPVPPLVVTGARWLDVASGRERAVAAVVVENGRIRAVHERQPPPFPDGATLIDAAGLTIVPGLVDALAHAAPTPDLDADYFYRLSLAHGVVVLRAVEVPLAWGVAQRQRASSGEVLAPRLRVAGAVIGLPAPTTTGSPRNGAQAGSGGAAERAAAAEDVRRQARLGADWVRLHPGASADIAAAVVAAARAHGVRVSATAGATPLAELAGTGVDAIEGLGDAGWDRLAPAEARRLAERVAKSRVVIIPLLRLAAEREFGRDHPLVAAEFAALPPNIRARVDRGVGTAPSARRSARRPTSRSWEARLGFIRALVAAGGRVATASGATSAGWPQPGMAVHHEVALLVDAGLSPLDALRAATVWPADLLKADRRAGFAPGGPADFFAVRGRPLADVSALADIVFVVRGGERLQRDDLLAHAVRATRRVK